MNRVRAERRVRRVALAAAAAVFVAAAAATGGAARAHADPANPGVYVTELGTFPPSVVPVSSGVALFVGAGTASKSGRPVSILSAGGLANMASSLNPTLVEAMQQYFGQGGSTAWVLTTPDDGAASLVAALHSVTPPAQTQTTIGWDLIVLPALGALDSADWLTVTRAATAAAAAVRGLALFDPPGAVVAATRTAGAAPMVALGSQLVASVSSPASAALVSSGLSDGSVPVAGAAVLAGIIAATDIETGTWSTPAGFAHPVVGGLTPQLVVDDDLTDALILGGINPWRIVPGSGPIMAGDRTLSRDSSHRYITVQRTANWIATSVATAMQPYVFAANDATTWSAIVAMTTDFLTTLWEEGALYGATPATAFTVACGLGTTMTGLQILNGYLTVSLVLRLESNLEPASVVLTQTMGSG